MLYMLVVIVCLGGECEAFVWRDMLSGQECSSVASGLGGLYGPGWSVVGAVCQRMFAGVGIAV